MKEQTRTWILIVLTALLIMIGGLCRANTLNAVTVYRMCLRLDLPEPEFITKQALLETGHFKCEYCSLESNNIFGFRYNHKYLTFAHPLRSVYYYRKWLNSRPYPQRDFYLTLAKYWGAPDMVKYINKVNSINV